MNHSSAHGYTDKHDATFIKVKEGKLWASDMVKPDKENCKGTRIKAMEAFNQSFVEVGNPDDIVECVWKYGDIEEYMKDGLYPVEGIQFEVEEKFCQYIGDAWNQGYTGKFAIVSLKQEQPSEEKDEIDYKAKYEKCIETIKKFDAGIISMYDL